MRVNPTLAPSGERRGRAVCGVRSPDRSRDQAERADRHDPADHGGHGGGGVRKDGADLAEGTSRADRAEADAA